MKMIRKIDQEIPRLDFIDMLKTSPRGIYASTSHHQDHPVEISSFGILKFKYDGGIYTTSFDGKRLVVSDSMPAFHEYEINFQLTI